MLYLIFFIFPVSFSRVCVHLYQILNVTFANGTNAGRVKLEFWIGIASGFMLMNESDIDECVIFRDGSTRIYFTHQKFLMQIDFAGFKIEADHLKLSNITIFVRYNGRGYAEQTFYYDYSQKLNEPKKQRINFNIQKYNQPDVVPVSIEINCLKFFDWEGIVINNANVTCPFQNYESHQTKAVTLIIVGIFVIFTGFALFALLRYKRRKAPISK